MTRSPGRSPRFSEAGYSPWAWAELFGQSSLAERMQARPAAQPSQHRATALFPLFAPSSPASPPSPWRAGVGSRWAGSAPGSGASGAGGAGSGSPRRRKPGECGQRSEQWRELFKRVQEPLGLGFVALSTLRETALIEFPRRSRKSVLAFSAPCGPASEGGSAILLVSSRWKVQRACRCGQP